MSHIIRTSHTHKDTRHAKAHRRIEKMKEEGFVMQPVLLVGREIADYFWGKVWCDHIESFRDYVDKLSQGRISVRNGSVAHLEIKPGRIEALVTGSSLYNVMITIEKYPEKKWDALKFMSTGRIASMTELLSGKLDRGVKEIFTNRRNGIFPLQLEMRFKCDCPDRASMCKHIAAVLYAAGARLDNSPEQIFTLRGVNHGEMVTLPAVKKTPSPKTLVSARVTPETVSLPDPLAGDDIIAWRMAVGDSQPAFAIRLNVSSTTVTTWEKNGANTLRVQLPTLIKLRKAWALTHR